MRYTYIYIGSFAALLLLAWLGSCSGESATTDSPTTYLNLAPEAQYVGMNACQSCHKEIYQSYLETGMGQSLYRPERGKIIERLGPDEVVFDSHSGYHYYPYWQGNDFLVLEFRLNGSDTTYKRIEKIDYIVGSGHQTRSYLIERNQHFYEIPITWYVNSQRWDLSPGYENGSNTRFDREIGEECMACHTGQFNFMKGTTNQFHEVSLGIDCEKCHGPGSIHITRKEEGELIDVGREIDYSIVNPAKLPIDLQFDVCQQCHLQGVNVLKGSHTSVMDYRPGMALNQVYDIFIEKVADDQAFGIASHAERLRESQCFINSADSLTCTTCHNPHKSIVKTDQTIFVKQCQSCHSSNETMDCGLSEELMAAENGNCVTCHMPKRGTSDIPHVRFTDHKIRVVTDTVQTAAVKEFVDLICMTSETVAPGLAGKAFLNYYERNDPKAEFLDRAAKGLTPASHFERSTLLFYQGNLEIALAEINQALAINKSDPWRLYRKGEILEGMARIGEAIDFYEQAYRANTRLTEAGQKVGLLALQQARDPRSGVNPGAALDRAGAIFRECLSIKPFDKSLLTNLGFVEMNSGNVQGADSLFRTALALDPFHGQALSNQVALQNALGNTELSEAYQERLDKLPTR